MERARASAGTFLPCFSTWALGGHTLARCNWLSFPIKHYLVSTFAVELHYFPNKYPFWFSECEVLGPEKEIHETCYVISNASVLDVLTFMHVQVGKHEGEHTHGD